jgi:arginine N-succinyltransferase
MFMFVLENIDTGQVRGTCQVFGMVGVHAPFYSYRMGTLTQTSKALGKTFRAQLLNLSTDLEGSSEVGGLFLHPGERAGGLGLLLARSRYMFIKLHRERFGRRVIAELRGVIDEGGGSPFWDAIAGKFFDMNFQEADEFNAAHGTQFIADLMPKTPIYTAMLPESARCVIGIPHPKGRAAMKMLEREGFQFDCYIDIFDGGPTMIAPTDQIRTIRESRELVLGAVADEVEGPSEMFAAGRLEGFRACCGNVGIAKDGEVTLSRNTAEMLDIAPGDRFIAMSR